MSVSRSLPLTIRAPIASFTPAAEKYAWASTDFSSGSASSRRRKAWFSSIWESPS